MGDTVLHPLSTCKRMVMKRVLRFIDSLSLWTGKAVSFFIPLLSIIVGYEVLRRYVFGSPTIWVHEMSCMLFATIIIIGGAYTFYHGSHVNLDVVYARFSPKTKAILDLFTSFFTFSFLLVLIVEGGKTAWNSLITLEHDSTQWAPPLYPIRLMLVLGALLLFLQVLAKFVRDFMMAINRSS